MSTAPELQDRIAGSANGPRAGGFRRAIAGSIIVVAVAVGLVVWTMTLTDQRAAATPPLPVIAAVPDFALTERSGRQITGADLSGKVWIADFIFTRCGGPCPDLSAKMRGLQQALAAEPDVRLVSICLDPENDTPAALVHYGQRFQADSDRWWFLTATDEKYVHHLVEKGFLQSVVPASEGTPLMHSTYMVVVDRQGRIRAAHDGVDRGLHDAMLRSVRALLAEPIADES